MKQKNVMRGLAGLSATLLAVSSAATAVAATRTDFINSKLGTSSFKLVEKGAVHINFHLIVSQISSRSQSFIKILYFICNIWNLYRFFFPK